MNPARVTTAGFEDVDFPADDRRRDRRRGGERAMVPEAEFRSYYGLPIINKPTWEPTDIAGYLFLGGLAGAGSLVAAGAQLTGRRHLARANKAASAAAAGLSLVALVHDLGRRPRFVNMLRTFKPTSPMSVGSWLLALYVPAAAVASASDLAGVAAPLGSLSTVAAAVLGSGVATYTAALVCNTAVPAWHDGYRYMPFVFAASAASAAAGVGLIGAPLSENAPVHRLGVVAGALEIATTRVMEHRMGLPGEAFKEEKPKRYRRLAEGLTALGVVTAASLGRRNRLSAAAAGLALVVGSALVRFAIFEAGMASAEDPRYTVVPQRKRREQSDHRRDRQR